MKKLQRSELWDFVEAARELIPQLLLQLLLKDENSMRA